MKEKFLKNKRSILIILTIILSLSGVVVLAEVADNQPKTANEEQAQVLDARVLSSKDREVNKEDSTKTETQASQPISKIISNDVSKETDPLVVEETEVNETTAIKETTPEEKIDEKIESIKYKDLNFANIGSVSAKDFQIAISTADNFVNIRELPNGEGKILGKLYKDEVAAIIGLEDGWAQVESGSVAGYVALDYLNTDLTKDEVIDNFASIKSSIKVNGLNVREEAKEDAKVLTVVYENEKYTVSEILEEWIKVSISKDDVIGYISKDFADLSVSFKQAISIEEEQEIIRKQIEEAERKAAEQEAARKAAQQEASRKAAAQQAAAQQAASKQQATASKSQPAPSSNTSESSAKEEIARRESGGNYNARNGKYIGRYQLSSNYLNGDHSPENQERVANQYVAGRYGSWQNALNFWNANGWY